MNYSAFLQQIHQEIVPSKGTEKRHIIRFKNPLEYQRCMAQIKKLKPSLAKLSNVQPIQMINAICCTMRSYAKLLKYKKILFIEEDIKVKVHQFSPVIIPSSIQRSVVYRTPSIPWGIKEIKAPQTWKHSEGKKVKIGVVDTGADFSHPDIRSCMAGGINFIQRNSPPHDDNGHGTHITGTIAANNRNNGIVGVAPKASIYAVKSFDKNGSAFVSDIILGIDWCVRHKMDIINMSFGMKTRSQSLRDAVYNAHKAGVIVVASSGNDGKASDIDYPARFVQTIAVGATNKKRQIALFSNRGKGINIYAPGERIYSTWTNDGYNELSGTSMATSHVTGAIALLLSRNPRMSLYKVKKMIKKTASPLKSKTKNTSSQGEINVLRAVQATLKNHYI